MVHEEVSSVDINVEGYQVVTVDDFRVERDVEKDLKVRKI